MQCSLARACHKNTKKRHEEERDREEEGGGGSGVGYFLFVNLRRISELFVLKTSGNIESMYSILVLYRVYKNDLCHRLDWTKLLLWLFVAVGTT